MALATGHLLSPYAKQRTFRPADYMLSIGGEPTKPRKTPAQMISILKQIAAVSGGVKQRGSESGSRAPIDDSQPK